MIRGPSALAAPMSVYLEFARTCNYSCAMCLREVMPKRDLDGYMSMETLEVVLDNLGPGTVSIGSSGWGEPLLTPNIIDMLSEISKRGYMISIITNGKLLEKFAHDLFRLKTLYHVTVSLDSLSSKKTGKHENPDVLRGMKVLSDLKGYHRRLPLLRVSGTVMKENIDELPKLVEEVARHGVKWSDCHIVNPYTKKMRASQVGPPDLGEFAKAFQKARATGEKLGVRVTCDRKSTIEMNGARTGGLCSLPFKTMFIDYKGNVRPCCHYLTKPLHNVNEVPLTKIWKSEEYIKLRSDMKCGKEVFCTNCMNGKMYLNIPIPIAAQG